MLTNLIINIKNVSKNHNKCELFNFNNKQKQTIYYVIFTVGVFFHPLFLQILEYTLFQILNVKTCKRVM